MKLSLVVAFLGLFPVTVWSCSCVDGSFNRPRDDAIRDDFCSEYSSDIYVATVEGATCNCIPEAPTDADLNCQIYTRPVASTTVVNTETIAQGVCDENLYGDVKNCSDVVVALAGDEPEYYITVEGTSVNDITTSQPTLQNITDPPGCDYICSFNNPMDETNMQPCSYMVEVGTVFKGSLTTGDTMIVLGPDVLTSCGYYGRVLSLNTEYVVGIGGACNPINEWNAVADYTEEELDLLTFLSENYNETDPYVCASGHRLSPLLTVVVLGVLGAVGFHVC